MRRNASLAVVAIAFALFALAGPSRSANEEASTFTHGIVKGLDAKAGTVTLDHRRHPGPYAVADPAILESVTVGQSVDFRLRKDGGDFLLTEIKARKEKATGGHQEMMQP